MLLWRLDRGILSAAVDAITNVNALTAALHKNKPQADLRVAKVAKKVPALDSGQIVQNSSQSPMAQFSFGVLWT